MCRKGAWAELIMEVTFGVVGSKPGARFFCVLQVCECHSAVYMYQCCTYIAFKYLEDMDIVYFGQQMGGMRITAELPES